MTAKRTRKKTTVAVEVTLDDASYAKAKRVAKQCDTTLEMVIRVLLAWDYDEKEKRK